MEVVMNATRAAALPRYRTENPGFPRENRLYRTGKPARFRPDLRVVYRAGSPVAVAPAPAPPPPAPLLSRSSLAAPPAAAAPFVSVHPAAAPPAAAPLAPAPPATARPAPAPAPAPARPGVSPSSATSPLRLTRRGRIRSEERRAG